ncbi:hypothetical protein OSB04_029899 [Centaurea solstitialis]|uniref:Uncharacterized protein n=1 Tax=Centaurea solstitialis TaxID=347529 RepID=A0AA38SJK5_9ASTR|nr:hypothetical protein OSB04_029899 [Centaurea solstitialis]
MGNSNSQASPIDTGFKLPSPLPTWPPGEGFASGTIDLGGLQVCQIKSFKKIWSTSQDKSKHDTNATFFNPSPIPNGFSILGSYCQSNDTPLFGWVLAGKDVSGGTLAAPVDYTLVWNSQDKSSCYIWLPTPPEGYKAVGYAITTSPQKPSLDSIRCVRSDLTEACETDALIWGSKDVNVYGLRPKVRGRLAQGVSVGTFVVLKTEDDSGLSPLSCLKNGNFDKLKTWMPNVSQIETLIPRILSEFYFHPKETYFPASTNWYFANGVRLYHAGDESNPISVEPTGSNLPQGGSNDGTIGSTSRLMKPRKNGIGEHIGDWEHVTLRVSNFDGLLYRVYFAQHSGGTWVETPALEFLDSSNKFAAYSSLNGHATYPAAGLVLQGTSVIGIKNDTAKSDKFFNVKDKYSIMAAEYISDVIEPFHG